MIASEFALEPTITPGGRGVFDVVVDGRTIFSKQEEHRFPEPMEIVKTLKSLQS